MARFMLTALVDTSSMDIDHLVDTSNIKAVQEYLQYDEDMPVSELRNIQLLPIGE